MLKHRIIPTLLFDGNLQCVKPISFGRPYRKLGPLEQYVRVLEKRNCDEVILIDIEATAEGRKPRADVIRSLTNSLYCPITYGGGISSLDDIKVCLASGADKVAIKTKIGIINNASRKFGSQAITAVIDCHDYNTLKDAERYARQLEYMGAGEILLTDTEHDGAFKGYNLNLIRTVVNSVGISVVASGGCNSGTDALLAIQAGASAIAAGSLFLFTETTPRDIAEYLNTHGVPVRL